MSGNITTSDKASNDVTFTGKVVISGDVDIDTQSAGQDGDITFSSTIKGAGGTDDLILDSGTGSIVFNANTVIGGDNTPLDTLTINSSSSNVALTIPQIGTGTDAGVTGHVDIGNSATATGSMRDALYNFGTGTVTITASSAGTGTTFAKTDDV